jgi:hypothetical protein
MKSLNKTIKSDDVQVEIFECDVVEIFGGKLQVDMNRWFKENSVEIISIDYTTNDKYIRAFVLYR